MCLYLHIQGNYPILKILIVNDLVFASIIEYTYLENRYNKGRVILNSKAEYAVLANGR